MLFFFYLFSEHEFSEKIINDICELKDAIIHTKLLESLLVLDTFLMMKL